MTTQNLKKGKAILIAKYFIKKNEKDKKGLDNKKIQKLLYYSQAWNLVFNREKLFPNKIEAWVHGPAVPEVYQFFKTFDFTNPSKDILDEDFSSIPAKERKLLDSVWEVYGKYDSDYLEILAHSELPWQEARKDLSPLDSSRNVIPEERMKEYYEQKLKEAEAELNSKNKK